MQPVAARYLPHRSLGEGTESQVILVRDPYEGGRRFALKRLPADLAGRALEEFLRLCAFDHPGIPHAHEFGVDPRDQSCYFTCEYVDGSDFLSGLRELPLDDHVEALAQLLRILQLVHDRGLLHRDLKPANVLVQRIPSELKVHLIDFGLADDAVERRMRGSLPYMAPEFFDGGAATPSSDLYALGVMLYELWVGRRPFEGADLMGWIEAHRSAEVQFPEDSLVPPSLSRLVLRLLAKDPEGRYPSARAVLSDLSRISVSSLPVETTASLRGRLRTPPPAVRGFESADGSALDLSTSPVLWAWAGTGEARRALLREFRALLAGEGRFVLHLSLGKDDPVPFLADQLEALFGERRRDRSLESMLASLEGGSVAFCVEDVDQRLPDHEIWLRRLLRVGVPLLLSSTRAPADDSFAAVCRESGRRVFEARGRRLSAEELHRELPRWLGCAPPEGLVEMLLSGAEAVDLAQLVEFLSLLVDSGGIELAGSECRLRPERARLDAGSDVVGLVRRRLELLPEDRLSLVQAGAVLGTAATPQELARLLGRELDPEDLVELQAQSFLRREVADGGERYRVGSAAAERAALSMMAPRARAAMHRRCAELDSSEDDPFARAWHRVKGGASEDALVAATAAVGVLMERGRFEAVLRLSEAALALDPTGETRAALLGAVGVARLKSGSTSAAIESLRAALEAAEQSSTREGAALELSRALERAGAFEEALKVLDDASAVGPAASAQRAFLAYRLGRRDEAEIELRRADEGLPGEPTKDRVRVHNTFGLLLFEGQRPDEARVQFGKAIELAEAAGNPIWRASAQHNLGRVEDDLGLLNRAHALFAESYETVKQYGDRQMQAVFATSAAQTLIDLGRTDEARAALDDARAMLESSALGPQFRRPLTTLLALVALSEGELEAAQTACERSRQLGEEQGDARGAALAELLRIDVLIRMGDEEQARAALEALCAGMAGGMPDELREYADMLALGLAAWFGDDDERRAALEASAASSVSRKRRAELAEARSRARARSQDWEGLVAEAEAADADIADTDLDARRALLQAMAHLGRVRLGQERSSSAPVRRAVDNLLSPGARARRAEALWWLGVAEADASLLDEALRLAQSLRHTPLSDVVRRDGQELRADASSSPELGRRLRSLEQLKEVTKSINREVDGDTLLRMVLDHAIEHTGAKRGFLILLRGDSMAIPAARNIESTDIKNPEFSVSSSVARSVARSGEAYLASDAKADTQFGDASSIAQLRLQSILCVPLQGREGAVGAMYLDDPTRVNGFDGADRDYVEDLSDYAVIALEKADLLRSNVERQRQLEHSKREIERLNHQLERTVAAQAQELVEVKESLRATRAELSLKYDYPEVVTRSRRMRKLLELVDRITDSSYPVYLFGESGTGKELIARCLHVNGPRSQGPYFSVNCGSFSPTLIETELFGHVKGAFTGADRDKPGVFELADGGTLFLDEVTDSSLELQSKLLRAIQFGEVLRVGSDEVRRVEVRVISASNRDLAAEVESGRFREDLFYRLNVHRAELPPLRERREDIPLLIEHFQEKHGEKLGARPLRFEKAALARLLDHDWRGNVRELENTVIDLLVRCSEDATVTEARLPARVRSGDSSSGSGDGTGGSEVTLDRGLKAAVEAFERSVIAQVLQECQGVRAQAARKLGMSERNLYKKLSKYGLIGGKEDEVRN